MHGGPFTNEEVEDVKTFPQLLELCQVLNASFLTQENMLQAIIINY